MITDKNELLTKAKDLLQGELTTIAYTTWIKNLEIKSFKDNKIVLIAKSSMQKDALETRHYDLICNTFNYILNKNCEITVIDENDESSMNSTKEEPVEDYTTTENYSKTFLNPKYTFDTFVVGNSNKFAHAAGENIAKDSTTNYNPLYIYGGVGLGKTHLMQAIGNGILKLHPEKKVLYVTSEKFINDLVNSIANANYKNELFRNKYRNIDVLLIDDIQFIQGKKMGQEEFFNTFNDLYQQGKQIVITSDKPPRDLPLLEERLKSRFEWGILADISMPDYETRLAILKKKVEQENIIIEDFILHTIAENINSNIRELEGTLNKIVAYAQLTHSPITIEMAQKAIDDMMIQKRKVLSSEFIQEVVAKYFNIDKSDLISSKKSNDIAYPRQIAMYLCRSEAKLSYPKIGQDFGNRDHSTVMYACEKIEKEVKENSKTKLIVESVKKLIQENA
ncbi:MAG: chromosomal replication initiator protein DnaA [Clostridia bacterium]|nr:chromosomal replication initiator protein DnaA [Clostridia bacterium]